MIHYDCSYIATTIFKTVVQRFYLWGTPIRPATWLFLHEVASGPHHLTPCSIADVEKSVISSVYIKMCAFYAKHLANSHYLVTTCTNVQGDINLLWWFDTSRIYWIKYHCYMYVKQNSYINAYLWGFNHTINTAVDILNILFLYTKMVA